MHLKALPLPDTNGQQMEPLAMVALWPQTSGQFIRNQKQYSEGWNRRIAVGFSKVPASSLTGQCLPRGRQAMCRGNGSLTFHCSRTGTVCWSTWAYRAFGLAAEQSGSRLDTRRWSLSLRLWWGTDENSHRCWYHRGYSLEREDKHAYTVI